MSSLLLLLVLLIPKMVRSRGTNSRERDESQISDGMIEKVAESLVAAQPCVKYRVCVQLLRPVSVPLVGGPALPFIDQRGSKGYRSEKEENTKGIEGPSREPSLPFFHVSALLNMADCVRGGVFADLRRPCPGLI